MFAELQQAEVVMGGGAQLVVEELDLVPAMRRGGDVSKSPEQGEEKQKVYRKRKTGSQEEESLFWCRVCGQPVGSPPHRENKECRIGSFDACHLCGQESHKASVHHVSGAPARSFMKAVHGQEFDLRSRSPVFKRRDRRDRE